MESSNEEIQTGQLVTVKKDSYGLDPDVLEDKENIGKTIYPWHNTLIKKGTVGLVLSSVKTDTIFLKVLWTINRESEILYIRLSDLKLLDYDV